MIKTERKKRLAKIAKIMTEARAKEGWSVKRASKESQLPIARIRTIESGESYNIVTLLALAKAYNMSVSVIQEIYE